MGGEAHPMVRWPKVLGRAPRRAIARASAWLTGSRHRILLTLVSVFLLLASATWFFKSTDDRGRTARLSADAWYYHAYLASLALDQDLDFRNEYEITGNWYQLGETPIGRPANPFGVGPAVFELPFFAAGHAIAAVGGDRSDGFGLIEVKLTLFASLLFSLGAIFFAARLCRRRLGGRYGPVAVALLVAAGGPVVYYAIRQPGYAHPFASFWAAWLINHWDASSDGSDDARSGRFWMGMGLLTGACALARPQLVLWAVLGAQAALSDVLRLRKTGAERAELLLQMRRWGAGAMLALLVLLPQLLAWHALYGSFVASPQGEGFMRWGQSAWSETLMSSRNGLFPWAPIYALGFVGLLVGLRHHLRLCSMLLLGILLQAYVNGAAWDWWAGGSFGGRRFDSCFPAFVFGLGILLLRPWQCPSTGLAARARRLSSAALAALASLLTVTNLNLAADYSAHTVHIYGGAPISQFLGGLPGLLGRTSAWASRMSNLPARALFAWRYDTDWDAYDYVVGVHQLAELYPGLNSFQENEAQALMLHPSNRAVLGLVRGTRGQLIAPEGRVRLFVGFNRRGPVELLLRAQTTDETAPRVWLNDKRLRLRGAGPDTFTARLEHYERGTNTLDIRAAPGFVLAAVELRAAAPHASDSPAPPGEDQAIRRTGSRSYRHCSHGTNHGLLAAGHDSRSRLSLP